MSQSYHCMRHYITTMSQTLTKPAWPGATTCVTAAGWKYHSAIPLPPLYFGMTKSQCAGRAQNYKASEASHIMVLHFPFRTPAPPTPLITFLHPCFCQCPCLDLYSSTVACRGFHFNPPLLPPLPSSVAMNIFLMGHQVSGRIFSTTQTSPQFDNGIWQQVKPCSELALLLSWTSF